MHLSKHSSPSLIKCTSIINDIITRDWGGHMTTSLKIKSKKKGGGKIITLFRLLFNSKYVHLKKLNISFFFKHIIENFAWQCNTEIVKFIQKVLCTAALLKYHKKGQCCFKKRLTCFVAISEVKSEDISIFSHSLLSPVSIPSDNALRHGAVTVQVQGVHVYIHVQTYLCIHTGVYI